MASSVFSDVFFLTKSKRAGSTAGPLAMHCAAAAMQTTQDVRQTKMRSLGLFFARHNWGAAQFEYLLGGDG